jgi:hypothetical protein|tara:strand:- start:971 stop:1822 length:852 start_codon:yes stop_codon:yes gene_type:complete
MENAILPGTSVHILKSKHIEDDIRITIKAPDLEVAGDGPFPVVFGTDADEGLGIYVETIDGLLMGGEIQPVIFVGVGYSGEGDFLKWGMNRTRDFSPTEDKRHLDLMTEAFGGFTPQAGGAEKFLLFLTTELRDWIKSNYNVSDDTTYIGDSMGGLFGLYTLFHKPESFKRYVIGSPWIEWDYPLCFDYEEKYAQENDDLDAIVYMAAGAEEHILGPYLETANPGSYKIFKDAKTAEYTQRMIDKLESRQYPNLKLTGKILEEETHFTIMGALIARGLRKVFN